MVGTPDEIFEYIKRVYPNKVISVIVWTRDEIKDLAMKYNLTLTNNEADDVLNDLASYESHEYGENELSAYGYICAIKGVDTDEHSRTLNSLD